MRHVKLKVLLSAFVWCFICYAGTTDLPWHEMSSIMQVSLLWMLGIRLVGWMAVPPAELQQVGFLSYVGSFLWFAVPVHANKSARRPFGQIVVKALQLSLIVLLKMMLIPILQSWLLRCVSSAGGGQVLAQWDHYREAVIYTSLFFVLAVCGTFSMDVMEALVPLISSDRFRFLGFNDTVFFATSVRDFWSRRYNRLVSTLLHDSVFVPLRRHANWPPIAAAFGAFLVSGILHMHVAHIGFRSGVLSALCFFILQAAASSVSTIPSAPALPAPLAWLFTQLFLMATSPLYLGLFVFASPDYLLKNPPSVPGPIHDLAAGVVPSFCPA